MPQRKNTPSEHADASPPVDAVILTALKEEYDAVLEVELGACPSSGWEKQTGPHGWEVAFRSFEGAKGHRLRVAVTWAAEMGGVDAVLALLPLVKAYAPRCVAMCGVCAGRKGKVVPGDIVIADWVWPYEFGKIERTVADSGDTLESFRGRAISYALDPVWKQRARGFQTDPERPLLKGLAPSYPLESKGCQIHIGPMASGDKVQQDAGIFERLSLKDYKVLGLEMEGAAVANLAFQHRIPHIIMKGVMDFADQAKNDRHKQFAARASAECLVAFLREVLPEDSEAVRLAMPSRRIDEAALSDYKRGLAAKPELRYLDLTRLVGITPGAHQTELDLLELAVAPSVHTFSEAHGRKEVALRDELRKRDLESTRRQEITRELEQLEDERWNFLGRQDNRRVEPLSFAQALLRDKRLVVIGDPGSGKSLLTRLAVLACVEGDAGERARRLLGSDDAFTPSLPQSLAPLREVLPIRLTLGQFGSALREETGLSLEAFLERHLREQHAGEELLTSLATLLEAGRVLLLCDGLDEVPEALRERVVHEVTGLLERYPEIQLLLTSRPHGYRPRVPHLVHTRLASLHPSQQQLLVSRLHLLDETLHHPEAVGVQRARQRTHALLRAIRTRPEWRTLSSNPLLLTLSALARTDGDGVPRHRVIVFENFMRTILGAWRAEVSSSQADQLLEAWEEVAAELVVIQEMRHAIAEARLRRLLADTLRRQQNSPSISAERAFHLALETGLIHKEGETVGFWHSTFAEFLAAHALTRDETDAANRILKVSSLPTLVLQLAAARLAHVLDAYEEADALAEGLLRRDERGRNRLLRPGLCAISECLADGVSFAPGIVTKVWAAWAEVLERSPPSPLWESFEKLTQGTLPRELPGALVERFARIQSRGSREVLEGLVRLVARLAVHAPEAAREFCASRPLWVELGAQRVHRAFGLSSVGAWDEPVITALGHWGETLEIDPAAVGRLVQRDSHVRDQLHALVRARLPGDEPAAKGSRSSSSPEDSSEENRRQIKLRFSAACLLAAAGEWNDDVVRVLGVALRGQLSSSEVEELKVVMRYGATERMVQRSLLSWSREQSTLGDRARDLVGEVAPLIEDMPQALLELSIQTQGQVLDKLEALILAIGMERRGVIDILWRWTAHPEQERRLRAIRILRQLLPHDERVLEVLRQGMRAPEEAWRALWARHALHHASLMDLAVTTLQTCARSPDPAVREIVYEKLQEGIWKLGRKGLDGWVACAADPAVPPGARLDAVKFVSLAQGSLESVRSTLYELLDTDDVTVRRDAAFELLLRREADVRATVIAVEEAARSDGDTRLLRLGRLEPFARECVSAILRGLPKEEPPRASAEDSYIQLRSPWCFILESLTVQDASCLELLVQALNQPGTAGDVARSTLSLLSDKHRATLKAIRARLQSAEAADGPLLLFRLLRLGFEQEELWPLAIALIQKLDWKALAPEEIEWLAGALQGAGAEEDAARLWLYLCEGEDLESVLVATVALARAHPNEAGAWTRPAVERLLGSPEPSLQVDAARLALLLAVHEEKALEVLLRCVELRPEQHPQRRSVSTLLDYLERHAFERPPEVDLPIPIPRPSRVDLVAMHTLYLHRPRLGMERLRKWLDDSDPQRFMCAAETLSTQEHCQQEVHAAIGSRVPSAPQGVEGIEYLLHLADTLGFDPGKMADLLLTRWLAESSGRRDEWPLTFWLRKHPAAWANLRRQQPARRDALAALFDSPRSMNRDTVALAVEIALAHVGEPLGRHVERRLVGWLDPSMQPDGASVEEAGGYLREVLDGQVEPAELGAMLCFERLMGLGHVAPERRVQLLKRALDMDIAQLDSEDTYAVLLELQGTAALELLELGGRHERLGGVLKAAFDEWAASWPFKLFRPALALLKLEPENTALRQSVLQTLIGCGGLFSSTELLDILAKAGFSKEERISVLCLCLGVRLTELNLPLPLSAHEDWRKHAPDLFTALAELGCEPDRHAAMLHEFISAYGQELSAYVQLQLVTQNEPCASDAAKLLLGAMAQDVSHWRETALTWKVLLAPRLAQKAPSQFQEQLFWNPADLSRRQEIIVKLSQVDEPQILETALVELAGAPVEPFLALYRRARQGSTLSDQEWSNLLQPLRLHPDEEKPSQFAKEWLSVELWHALSPSA